MGKGASTNMMNTAGPQPIPRGGMPRGGKGGAVSPNTSGTFQGYMDSFNASPISQIATPLKEDTFNEQFGGSTPMNLPQPPPAGGGLLGGAASAANLFNQQRQRNDFINSDNELNRIRAEQMALERKARQEALNRSYYNQPAEPTGPQLQPATIAEPAPPLQPPTALPASRNPYDRFGMGQMERLNAAYRNRLERFNNPMDNIPDRPGMETPEQREKLFLSNLIDGPVNPNQVMNRFTGVRRAAFGEPLRMRSAFQSPFSGSRSMGRESFNPALFNAPMTFGPRVSAGRGGKGGLNAYPSIANI